MFPYKSNDTNFTQYNQVLVALFIRSNFALECACALFLEKEVVQVSYAWCYYMILPTMTSSLRDTLSFQDWETLVFHQRKTRSHPPPPPNDACPTDPTSNVLAWPVFPILCLLSLSLHHIEWRMFLRAMPRNLRRPALPCLPTRRWCSSSFLSPTSALPPPRDAAMGTPQSHRPRFCPRIPPRWPSAAPRVQGGTAGGATSSFGDCYNRRQWLLQ
jgi:hypothetical protein